jgi:hemerythrin-like metal-binding protein
VFARTAHQRRKAAEVMTEFTQWERGKHSQWIDEMDCQHENIIWLMDNLSRRDTERASKAELANWLDTLRECTARHFKEEEAYMAATGYPKLDVHQVMHRDLLIKLDEHMSRFNSGSGRLGVGLLSFLKYWLAAHITGFDRQVHRHAPRRSSAEEPADELKRAALAPAEEVP